MKYEVATEPTDVDIKPERSHVNLSIGILRATGLKVLDGHCSWYEFMESHHELAQGSD